MGMKLIFFCEMVMTWGPGDDMALGKHDRFELKPNGRPFLSAYVRKETMTMPQKLRLGGFSHWGHPALSRG